MKRRRRLSGMPLRALLRAGARMDMPLFRLTYRKSRESCMRLALITPRAVDKRSAVRNRIRRRAREWARVQPDVMVLPVDVALLFSKSAAGASRRIFREALAEAFARLRRMVTRQ